MAKSIARHVGIVINGVDITDRASAVATNLEGEEIDLTCFGPSDYREFDRGLRDATFTLTLFQDFAAGETHATLQPLYDNNTAFDIVLKPSNAAASATNPHIRMQQARLMSYSPLSASVGEAVTMELSVRNAGPQGVTYVTA